MTHLNLMFGRGVRHHGDLKLGHVLQLLVRLDPLLESVNFFLKLRMSVREEGCRLKIDLRTVFNEESPLSLRLKELF